MKLSALEQDALKEIGEIGAHAAAAAASRLVDRRIQLVTNQYHEVPVRDIAATLKLGDARVVGAATKLEGKLRGALLVAFPDATARGVSDLMLKRPVGAARELGAMEQSALKELANILSGAYLKAFVDFLGVDTDYGVPLFAVAGWDALTKYTFLGTAPGAQHVWSVASRLDVGLDTPAHLFLLLDQQGMDTVRAAVNRRLSPQ